MSGTAAPPSDPTAGSDLRQIVSYSLASGLCPLIPIPLLDDWARDLLRHRLVAQLALAAEQPLASDAAKLLACGYNPPTASGCAIGCLRTLVIKPIVFIATVIVRKLVRKILFFLTIKDTVDTFSQTFHEAYLVRHALRVNALRGGTPTTIILPDGSAPSTPANPGSPGPAHRDPQLLAVRQAVEEVYRNADTGTVSSLARSLFKSSRRSIKQAVRHMTKLVSRRGKTADAQLSDQLENEGEVHLRELIDELTEDLESQATYLRQLEQRLEQRLGLFSPPGEAGNPAHPQA
ncbi:MAG: hypothetical protein AAF560_00515 [Acidobacteriota bacterium]